MAVGGKYKKPISDLCDVSRKDLDAYLRYLISQYSMSLNMLATGVYNLEAESFIVSSNQNTSVFDFGFDYIISDGGGENKTRIEDVCSYVSTTSRRVVLLGEPGCGKTISIAKLTVELAERAVKESEALIPITISLGSYKEDIQLEEYIKKFLFSAFGIKCDISKKSHYIFIFDALNEVAVSKRTEVINYISDLPHYIVSCRKLDYNKVFENAKNVVRVEIQNLNITQIQHAINAFDPSKLLWTEVGGSEELLAIYKLFLKLDELSSFWKSPYEISEHLNTILINQSSAIQYTAWVRMHQLGLLPLCRIPLFLRLICDIWKNNVGTSKGLPSNRGKVLEDFVKQCFDWERNKINKNGEVASQKLYDDAFNALVFLSYLITIKEEGTGIAYNVARKELTNKFPAMDIDKTERFVQGAGILMVNSDEYRFAHQLHQEYFASQALNDQINAGYELSNFFDNEIWWKPSGWEEPAVILTGILKDDKRSVFFMLLAKVQPELLFRCVYNSGVYNLKLTSLSNEIKNEIKLFCSNRLRCDRESAISRIHIGQILEKLNEDVEPLIWIPCNKRGTYISKYPITNGQFLEFVREGYNDLENWNYSDKAVDWYHNNEFKNRRLSMRIPAVYISWYEAMAFCQWISKKYGKRIRLLSREEWNSYIGDASDVQKSIFCSSDLLEFMEETLPTIGLGSQSEESIISDVGLVWEWCIDEIKTDDKAEIRFLKGGSYVCSNETYRLNNFLFETYPEIQTREIGFRVLTEL